VIYKEYAEVAEM